MKLVILNINTQFFFYVSNQINFIILLSMVFFLLVYIKIDFGIFYSILFYPFIFFVNDELILQYNKAHV